MDTTEYNYLFKYIMVGDTSVGKSTLLGMFVDNRFREENQPTLGVEFASRRVEVRDLIIKLQIWDTAGQEAFRTITRAYYKNTVGVLLVFDINQRKTFDSVYSWLLEIRENSQPHVDVILVGNKTDLEQPQVSEQEIAGVGLPYFLTSAKSGENVNDPFMQLSQRVLQRVLREQIDCSDPRSGVRRGATSSLGGAPTDLKLHMGHSRKKQSGCSC